MNWKERLFIMCMGSAIKYLLFFSFSHKFIFNCNCNLVIIYIEVTGEFIKIVPLVIRPIV